MCIFYKTNYFFLHYINKQFSFSTSVDTLVLLQANPIAKCLIAYTTHKRSLTSVDPLVCLQVTFQVKRPTTHITRKGFMTCVESLVFLQVTDLGACLIAHITNKRFFTGVFSCVFSSPQPAQKPCCTRHTQSLYRPCGSSCVSSSYSYF